MTFEFQPEARIEFIDAIAYYEGCREGLGLRFSREVYATVYAKGHEVPNIAKTRSLSLPVIAKVLETDLDKPVVTPYLVEEDELVGV